MCWSSQKGTSLSPVTLRVQMTTHLTNQDLPFKAHQPEQPVTDWVKKNGLLLPCVWRSSQSQPILQMTDASNMKLNEMLNMAICYIRGVIYISRHKYGYYTQSEVIDIVNGLSIKIYGQNINTDTLSMNIDGQNLDFRFRFRFLSINL